MRGVPSGEVEGGEVVAVLEHEAHVRHMRGVPSGEVEGGEIGASAEHEAHGRHGRGVPAREAVDRQTCGVVTPEEVGQRGHRRDIPVAQAHDARQVRPVVGEEVGEVGDLVADNHPGAVEALQAGVAVEPACRLARRDVPVGIDLLDGRVDADECIVGWIDLGLPRAPGLLGRCLADDALVCLAIAVEVKPLCVLVIGPPSTEVIEAPADLVLPLVGARHGDGAEELAVVALHQLGPAAEPVAVGALPDAVAVLRAHHGDGHVETPASNASIGCQPQMPTGVRYGDDTLSPVTTGQIIDYVFCRDIVVQVYLVVPVLCAIATDERDVDCIGPITAQIPDPTAVIVVPIICKLI